MPWLFGGAIGVFVAAYLWLLFATGLVVSAPWLRHLDVALLGIGLLVTLAVLGSDDSRTPRSPLVTGIIVTGLATVISRTMLWVALRVDETLLFAMAADHGTSVQELGLTPLRYVGVSALGFAVAGLAMALVFAWLPRRRVRG